MTVVLCIVRKETSMSSDMAQVTCLKTNMIWNNKKILKEYLIIMLNYCKKKMN